MFPSNLQSRDRRFTTLLPIRRTGRPLTQAVLTFLLCFSTFAQDWKTVADGVEHAQVRREFSGKPVNINLLRLDLKKVRLDVHHAMDKAIGTETTSSIAKRHGAVAAINAGFFRLDKSLWAGDTVGLLMINLKLLSESSQDRTVLKISNEPAATLVEIVATKTVIFYRLGTEDIVIAGINREVKQDELVLFKPEFNRTTLTRADVYEIAIERGKVVRVSTAGDMMIPPNGTVLSATGIQKVKLQHLKAGDNIMFGERFDPVPGRSRVPQFSIPTVDDMVAGVPQLIRDSKIDITWQQERASKAFVETRHPRTAVAKLKDGKFLMLTADGRTEESAGLDLYDLAAYMLELGATDAMNLDGGGSTTMFLGGKVVNKPSDKEGERKVGDAILVTLRKKR